MAAAKAEKLYIEPLKRLVTLCKESGQLDKQLQYLVKLDTLSPLNFERKVELGEVFLAKGDTDKARACFEEARRVVGRVAADMLSESLMEIAAKIGEKDQDMALRCVTEAIAAKGEALGRDDLWMFNNRGILLRRQGLWKQAVENYEKALPWLPTTPVCSIISAWPMPRARITIRPCGFSPGPSRPIRTCRAGAFRRL